MNRRKKHPDSVVRLSMNIRHIKFLKLDQFEHPVLLWRYFHGQDDANASGSASAPSTEPSASAVPEASHPLLEMTPDLPELEGRNLWRKLEWSERSSVDEWKTGEWDIYFARTYLQYKQIWYILYTYALHTCICCIDNHWELISNNHY